MGRAALFFSLVIFIGCGQDNSKIVKLEKKIQELESVLNESYRPGYGEIMPAIQDRHAKLWWAGVNGNWELANFAIHEIEESIDDLKLFQKEAEESKHLDIILPGLDSVEYAIGLKDIPTFKKQFLLLTNLCNTCHKATKHEYIQIQIPESQNFPNQRFGPYRITDQ